ncbi:uncharacterized protein LOC142656087 [Rhinoderma darwinii]|uniref:uncharacterized protein LOC142656087 n=1 Tax=Rhinoderma darwinii TaxID=43563 RepID=UPI003F666D1D
MQGTITDILIQALENINEESLKSFKRKLSSFNVQPPYKKIPRSKLDEKSARDVVDSIISYYTLKDGPRITVKVLRDINERQVSRDLQESIQRESAKKAKVEEKTPRKSLVPDKLRDATNRIPSHTQRRQHHRQEYGKENVLDFNNSSQSSDEYSHPKTTQTRNVRKSLNMNTGQKPKNNGRSSTPRQSRRRLPSIKLAELTDTDIEIMSENHEGKVHRFACLLFKHFVPFRTYQKWTKNTNFDGCGGKYAIPDNLQNAIIKEVRKFFSLKQKDKRQIKTAINELLRKPRLSGWPTLI